MKILLVEDDPSIADILRIGLENEAHIVDIADNGSDGSFMGRTYEYDIIILDHSLPKKSGIMVCKDIRGVGNDTPIIFVSVTGDTDTKVLALESGADDYITKPFSFSELHSRIKAISRRHKNEKMKNTELRVHDLILHKETRQVYRGEKRIRLTKKEFSLLEYMMKNKGKMLSRAIIMEHVWTSDRDPFSNTVEAHISNLRKKINISRKPDLIANASGHGYIMDEPAILTRYR